MFSKCLCQQLKINPDPTHGENRLGRSWRSCVAYREVYRTELHLLTELEVAAQTKCSARYCKTLLKEGSAPNQQTSLILRWNLQSSSKSYFKTSLSFAFAFAFKNSNRPNWNESSTKRQIESTFPIIKLEAWFHSGATVLEFHRRMNMYVMDKLGWSKTKTKNKALKMILFRQVLYIIKNNRSKKLSP